MCLYGLAVINDSADATVCLPVESLETILFIL